MLFRGKRLDNGEWVEGDYFRKYIYDRYDNGYLHHLIGWQVTDNDGEKFNDYEDVDPDTVGQYTGLKDRYGDRIWEGDLVEHGDEVSEVFFDTENSCFDFKSSNDPFAAQFSCDYEILGNIHDNPEFLEGGAK